MEILGVDPKLMICKIIVLPIKLYPLFNCNDMMQTLAYLKITHKGFEPLF